MRKKTVYDEKIGEITLHPVGVVSSPLKEVSLKAGKAGLEQTQNGRRPRENHRIVKETIADLVIAEEWEELLDGIEEFSHALVLYWPHLLDPNRRKLRKVHPMGRKELPLTGIFATRSPARPNPVLVSVVGIQERKGNVLRVIGLEAVNGSPILDIKPHVVAYDTKEQPKVAPWMEQIQHEFDE